MLVLLPTRRAVRALREAFLRQSGGRALLLPQLRPIGDLDADALGLDPPDGASEAAGDSIPPAIPELRRRLLLTRLVLAWGERRGETPLLPGQAAMLARELARFLDEVTSERGDLAGLQALVPEDYAEHWQLVLRFLAIVTEHWPTILAAEGALDPAARRNAVLEAEAEAWRRDPPARRIVAAGIDGALPAAADLLAVIARLPRGAVLLHGLDPAIDAECWAAIEADPTHPQHVAAQLLQRLGAAPSDVRVYPPAASEPSAVRPKGEPPHLDPPFQAQEEGLAARTHLVAELLRPAAETHRWREMAALPSAALNGLIRLDCAGPQEEAGMIALLLRERLVHPGQTAALVTPDRDLARRVAAELRRWSIEIDDSAGTPLNRTPPGTFLRLIVDLAASGLAPVPLLAALKHPLAAAGLDTAELRARVRALERAALRGPRPAPGLAGLRAALAGSAPAHGLLLDRLEAGLAPLLAQLASAEVSLAELVRAHIAAAEQLAADDAMTGAERLWAGEAGESAARFVAELVAAAGDFPPLRGADYPALFEALLAGPVVRPRYGRHPRLAIWGLLEARLQSADLVILAGLNEGTWPAEAASDPWLSRPMRAAFGLPSPERAIGIAARDFAQGLAAREVVLTRATRAEGAPTVPSRWLLRLDAVLQAAGRALDAGAPRSLLAWQAQLDRPERRLVLTPPAPRPPIAARPRRLSVTEIETWMRDPYGIYARHVLRLRALDPIDADPGAAERGIAIHNALDAFVQLYPRELPIGAEAELLAIGRMAFGAALSRPGVAAFWWPRFCRIARWFLACEVARRSALDESRGELKGHIELSAPAGAFILSCRADRIDRRRDGELVIIDYKTGTLPRPTDVDQGFSPQLPLEAAIAAAGGFAGLVPAAVAELAYWRLSGGEIAGEIRTVESGAASVAALAGRALSGLKALIARFDNPATPYRARPRPERAPRFSDYAHLARVKEWSVMGEVE
jgi:ATP-dependent helicase/nuclease subunit B